MVCREVLCFKVHIPNHYGYVGFVFVSVEFGGELAGVRAFCKPSEVDAVGIAVGLHYVLELVVGAVLERSFNFEVGDKLVSVVVEFGGDNDVLVVGVKSLCLNTQLVLLLLGDCETHNLVYQRVEILVA